MLEKENATVPTMAQINEKGQCKVNGLPKNIPPIGKALSEFEGEREPPKNIFIPSWGNKPEEVKPILSYLNTPILTEENLGILIAVPGMGKSSICEAIETSFINPSADCLGFKVSQDCKGIIRIDNEQTDNDVWNSFYRRNKRAGLKKYDPIGPLVLAGFRNVPRLKDKQNEIIRLLEHNPCDLLIIDGMAELTPEPNDLPGALEWRFWIRERTKQFNISIFGTIHPNPNSTKPHGHIGTVAWREAECCLLAKKIDETNKIITSDFDYGKNRNNADITGGYRWSEDHSMFISSDIDSFPSKKIQKDKNKAELLTLKLLPPPTAKTYTELIEALMKHEQSSKPTAKRRLSDMVDLGFIKKTEDDFYRAIV